MARTQRGTKRICQSCNARFYDLGRNPIICPSCNATFDPEAILRSRRNRPSAAVSAAVSKAAVVDLEVATKSLDKDANIVLEGDDVKIVGDENDDAGEDENIEGSHDLVEDEFKVPSVTEDKTED